MKKSLFVAAGLALAPGAVLAPAALGSGTAHHAVGPTVTVQVRSLTKNLRGPVAVRGESGSITKGGAPSGKCSGDSAAGALDAATHGRWTGKYYAGEGIFVESILGVKPPSKNDYWSIYVNGRSSNYGACEIKLRRGEKLLFKLVK